jgi:hypothetical protein
LNDDLAVPKKVHTSAHTTGTYGPTPRGSAVSAPIRFSATTGGAEPSPGVGNLFRILAETAPSPEYERLERARKGESLRYADLKEVVAEHLV